MDHPASFPVVPAPPSAHPRRLHIRPAWSGPRTPFLHTWEGIGNIDQFRWMVRRDVQDQLDLARRELGVRHVRAVGMYDDELRVFCPSPASFLGYEPATPRTNWQIVDYIIDSLQDRGLHPMFTTSFVPSAMTSGPTTVFTGKSRTSPPDDWRQWERLVRESVQHAVERYGLAVVRQWYFEVWNEPNLHGWFWGGTKEDFMQLWRFTHAAIKSVDASLKVGGPSCGRAEWIDDLIAYGAAHDCPADYIVGHIYNNDSPADIALAPFDGAQDDKTSKSPDSAIGVIRGVRTLVDRTGFKGELHWNEWGRSFRGVDHCREQPSEAAFVVRLLAEVSQEADSFAYWCLSDVYDQVGYGREAFYGGYGLLNLQGLRKPAFHAFQLLRMLGTERVAVAGDHIDSFYNAIATASGPAQGHVLVYAYDHGDGAASHPIEVAVNLPPGARPGRLFRVDEQENNVLTRWRELGAPDYLSRGQIADLRAVDGLTPSSSTVHTEPQAGGLTAHFAMKSNGLALLEFNPA